MKIQNVLPLTADLSSQSEEKVESDECTSTAATAATASSSSAITEGLEASDAVDLQQQIDDDEDAINKDNEVVSGKKKGTRKKRSLNWEEAEKSLLVEVVKPKVECVENRSVDAKSVKTKRLAWLQITKQFNALNFRQRALEQIQVQWRAMKNAAKREHNQKNSKDEPLEGIKLAEFIEDMHKDPVIGRSHSRGNVTGLKEKKDLTDLDDDDDDDTPLASLPTSTNSNSEDTLQTSTVALPSPPPSGDSQNEIALRATTNSTAPTKKKPTKPKTKKNSTKKKDYDDEPIAEITKKSKRQHTQEVVSSDDEKPILSAKFETQAISTMNPNQSFHPEDEKMKKQYFELLKRARLTEMDYARREHEQRMRFGQIEQDLKMHFIRQERELHMLHQREEHQKRISFMQAEHEARMKIFKAAGEKFEEGNDKNTINSY